MITLTLSTGKKLEVESGTRGIQIAGEFEGGEEKLAGLMVNNQVKALTSSIPFDADVAPIYFNEPEGSSNKRPVAGKEADCRSQSWLCLLLYV